MCAELEIIGFTIWLGKIDLKKFLSFMNCTKDASIADFSFLRFSIDLLLNMMFCKLNFKSQRLTAWGFGVLGCMMFGLPMSVLFQVTDMF